MDSTERRSINRKYPLELRLMLMTERQGDCVIWLGNRDKDGYGRIRIDGAPNQRLTRVIWQLANQKPVPDGLVVRHRCDNPPCVNPAHLIIGTVIQNVHDRDERGRACVGEAHHNNRLKASDVREIRRRLAHGESVTAVAREFQVRPWSIQGIRDGRTWKHLT